MERSEIRGAVTDILRALPRVDRGARDAITGKVHGSYQAFRARIADWSRVSIEAVLRARG